MTRSRKAASALPDVENTKQHKTNGKAPKSKKEPNTAVDPERPTPGTNQPEENVKVASTDSSEKPSSINQSEGEEDAGNKIVSVCGASAKTTVESDTAVATPHDDDDEPSYGMQKTTQKAETNSLDEEQKHENDHDSAETTNKNGGNPTNVAVGQGTGNNKDNGGKNVDSSGNSHGDHNSGDIAAPGAASTFEKYAATNFYFPWYPARSDLEFSGQDEVNGSETSLMDSKKTKLSVNRPETKPYVHKGPAAMTKAHNSYRHSTSQAGHYHSNGTAGKKKARFTVIPGQFEDADEGDDAKATIQDDDEDENGETSTIRPAFGYSSVNPYGWSYGLYAHPQPNSTGGTTFSHLSPGAVPKTAKELLKQAKVDLVKAHQKVRDLEKEVKKSDPGGV